MARATRELANRFFTVSRDNGVAVITLDEHGEPVNTISTDLGDALLPTWSELQTDPGVKAILITSGKKDAFVAGAKIEMLQGVRSAQEGAELSRGGQRMFDFTTENVGKARARQIAAGSRAGVWVQDEAGHWKKK